MNRPTHPSARTDRPAHPAPPAPSGRAERFRLLASILRCPICHQGMELIESGSLFCPNRHTYDISKHGYANLLTRPSKNSLYGRNLFEARQRIIRYTALYSALHETIAKGLDAFLPAGSEDREDRVTTGSLDGETAGGWIADSGPIDAESAGGEPAGGESAGSLGGEAAGSEPAGGGTDGRETNACGPASGGAPNACGPASGGAPRWLADLGCGEGSHLDRVLEHLGHDTSGKGPVIRGVGLDISREGILLAAKLHKHIPWLVADLAKSPLKDRSLHAVLNILSPANYGEFRRILKPGGLCVKVVPGPSYLQELRSALIADEEKRNYHNDRTVALFRQQFRLLEHSRVRNSVLLNRSELGDLARMTPLAWSAGLDRLERFTDHDSLEITIDLEVLIGRTEN